MLTTRQRDILKIILEEQRPVSSIELAGQLNLTPRQVSYSIQGIRVWLNQHNQDLKTIQGAGFVVEVQPDLARSLVQQINSQAGVQIILSASQRQQLLALFLLTYPEPIILSQLEQKAQVSRMTITKDLDEIEPWLNERGIALIRKPHFGIQASGEERDIQQCLAEIVWGETPFSSEPVIQITHAEGLVFLLEADARRQALVDYTRMLLERANMRRTIGLVAKAEEQLGGRFTDDGVLHLALVFSILSNRIAGGYHLTADSQQIQWLETLPIWPVAGFISRRLSRDTNAAWQPTDVAGIAVQMMAAPRNEILPGEIEHYGDFSQLIERLMIYISQAFKIPKLKYDRTLQNGLLNHIVPACFRQRFHLWFPVSLSATNLPEQDERENEITAEIARMVYEHTRVDLPRNEVDNIVVLLRAAIIRNRSYRFERVIIVCPSGMATAQLLLARLHARFPYLNGLEVISLRDLTLAMVASADLVLTTIPLPRQFASSPKVIQVHPLLMPEDIEVITRFLS